MFLVPLTRRDFGFFDRQRDLFSDWLDVFDDSWRAMDLASSRSRFDDELARVQKELHELHQTSDEAMKQLHVEGPYVTDPEGNKKLSLRFDCSRFKPEEVTVKTTDNNLEVHAVHKEESENKKIHREFHRHYTLPEHVDAKTLKAQLAKDGVLSIEAPVKASIEAPKENLIPIEKM